MIQGNISESLANRIRSFYECERTRYNDRQEIEWHNLQYYTEKWKRRFNRSKSEGWGAVQVLTDCYCFQKITLRRGKEILFAFRGDVLLMRNAVGKLGAFQEILLNLRLKNDIQGYQGAMKKYQEFTKRTGNHFENDQEIIEKSRSELEGVLTVYRGNFWERRPKPLTPETTEQTLLRTEDRFLEQIHEARLQAVLAIANARTMEELAKECDYELQSPQKHAELLTTAEEFIRRVDSFGVASASEEDVLKAITIC